MGQSYAATLFRSAGNITHTPAYGHMIALGVLHAVGLHGANPEQVTNAEGYRAAGGFQVVAVADLIPARRKALMQQSAASLGNKEVRTVA